jgi:hypothetical protein
MVRRLCVVLILFAFGACFQSQQAPVVGEWHSTEGDYVLHLFAGGKGSFNSRGCTWQGIDDYSVYTDCQAAIRDNKVRVFTVRVKDGHEVGTLESLPEVEFTRSPENSAHQSETADMPEDQKQGNVDCGSTLEPTWVEPNEAIQAMGGQVLIAAFNTSESHATLRITMPDTSVTAIDNMPVGTRRLITINKATYFLDLLDADDIEGAQVSLTRKN